MFDVLINDAKFISFNLITLCAQTDTAYINRYFGKLHVYFSVCTFNLHANNIFSQKNKTFLNDFRVKTKTLLLL